MDPATAGWAARAVAQWSGVDGGAWDVVGLSSRRREGRRRTFDAMVDVLADHLSGRHRSDAMPGLLALLRWLEAQRLARDIYGRKRFDLELVEVAWRSLPLDDLTLVQAMLVSLTALVQSEACPVGGSSLPVVLRLLDRTRVDGNGAGIKSAASVLVEGYGRSIAAPSYGTDDAFPGPALLRLAAVDEPLVVRVLTPFDFEHEAREAFYLDVAARSERVRLLRRGLRTHLRFLAACLADASLEPTDAVVDAAARHVVLGSGPNLERGRVDAIGVPDGALWSNTPDPLPALLAEALRRLDEPRRERLLAALVRTQDPTLLARLLTAGPPSVSYALRARLAELGPENAETVFDLTSLRLRRNALLEAGEIELAATFFRHEQSVSTWGPVRGRRSDELAFELRLAFAQGRYDHIIARKIAADEWSNDEERTSAERSLDFYRALSEMSREHGDLATAERILERLSKRDPTILAYPINLHALRIKRAVTALAPEVAAPKLEAEAAQLLERRDLTESDRHTIEANLALLDVHTGNFRLALDRLRRLPELVRFTTVPTATAVRALMGLGERAEADAWVETAAEWAGWTEALKALRDSLDADRTVAPHEVSAISKEDSIEERRAHIGATLEALRHWPIEEQAYIASGGRDLGALLFDLLSQAAAALQEHAPSLVSGATVPHFEDNLTRLMASLIRPHVSGLNWSVHAHPHRGGTARNPTIPDLVLRHAEEIAIAVVEAVWGPRPTWTDDVKRQLSHHFKKTFSYGPARYLFHVIYTRGGAVSEILAEASRLAEHESPPGFACKGSPVTIEDLGRPPRVVSTHDNPRSASHPIQLTQLVIDLGREPEDAAHSSSKTS